MLVNRQLTHRIPDITQIISERKRLLSASAILERMTPDDLWVPLQLQYHVAIWPLESQDEESNFNELV